TAFEYGEQISDYFRSAMESGLGAEQTRLLCSALDPSAGLETEALPLWKKAFEGDANLFPEEGWGKRKKFPGTEAQAQEVLKKGVLPDGE
ncbi:MAG: hypothetical protein ACYTG7_23840, partial [Planctomycetota bacterium]